MSSEKFLQQVGNPVSAFVPVDMQTGDNNGDWVSLKEYHRAVAILHKGVGTANDDPVFKMQQAKDNAGGSVKDLDFTVIYKKVGAQSGIGQWSRVTQTAATSHTDAVSAEAEALMLVEIDGDDLDMDNGFDHIRLDVANIGGNAQLGAGLYILFDPRYPQEPLPSAL